MPSIFSITVYIAVGSNDVVKATKDIIGLSPPTFPSSTNEDAKASSSMNDFKSIIANLTFPF